MKKAIVLLFLSGLLSAQAGLTRLEAISMIETGDNDRVVVSAGEISRYQIMPQVWRTYSSSRDYRNVSVSAAVAARHLKTIETSFRARAGRDASEFDIYVMWNAGLGYYAKKGFNPKQVAPVVAERAQRFSNLRHMRVEQYAGIR